jgi:chromosome segregation ATPase
VSQQQRDYPESELTLVEESQKVTTVVSVQPENIEAKSVPHIHESVTRIAAMEERIQSLQNQNEVIDSKLKASLEQQHFLENQIREKDNDIKALTNEVATQKKKCKSAFSEVEALSDDLRSTLQSSTALKIRIDEEVSARKAVESQMSELKELHDRNSAPLSPPPPPPPSPPHKEVNEDLVLSNSSFEALRSIITQLQRGDKGEFDGDLVTTADELVMSLRVSLDTEMQQFDDLKSKSQELGNDVQNLKEKLQECETQRSANEDEFRVKLEEMVRTNEDRQNLMGREISDHKKKVDSLTSEQVTAANEVIALQIKIKSLEDEKKALAVSAKESIRNLDTTSTPIISPLQLSELKQQNQK